MLDGQTQENVYWIDKHRYYELKHFCLQYPLWCKSLTSLGNIIEQLTAGEKAGGFETVEKPKALCRMYQHRINLIFETAKKTVEGKDLNRGINDYIFKAVTNGYSYDYLKKKLGLPLEKDEYYQYYKRFFWLLDKIRE